MCPPPPPGFIRPKIPGQLGYDIYMKISDIMNMFKYNVFYSVLSIIHFFTYLSYICMFIAFTFYVPFQAGLPKQNLMIALEPEFAAVYFKSSPEISEHVDMSKVGFKYMVIDNGGLLN